MNVKKRGYLSFLLGVVMMFAFAIPAFAADTGKLRSEERRVGKEC